MEKEIHNLHFATRQDFKEDFTGKFANRDQQMLETVESSLFGDVRISEIAVQEVNPPPKKESRKIDLATLRIDSKLLGVKIELSGLLYNPVLEKVSFLETSYRMDKLSDNTSVEFYPEDARITDHFLEYLDKLHLNAEEKQFFSEFPKYFNNPSFGVVEEEPGNIHRMIYADKIPIGVYYQEERYLGLIFNKHNKMYELRNQGLKPMDYEAVETKYLEAEDLTSAMFSCFENLHKYDPKQKSGPSSSIFGSAKIKTIAILSADEPENESLQLILGIGLKSHLKHQDRTHMQYEGLAYNKALGKVGKVKVFTERHYEGMGHFKLQSKMEYLPDNPEKRKIFLYDLDKILEERDIKFFQERVIPFFSNLSLGKQVAGGDVTLFYPIYADGVAIGNYLVNTNTSKHNYRGLMVSRSGCEPICFQNSLHLFEGAPRI